MLFLFLLLPPLGALIGWLTNVMAIRYLFCPRRPVEVLGVTLWGIVPRYRSELAGALAGAVAERLFTAEDITRELAATDLDSSVLAAVMEGAQASLEEKLTAIPGVVRRMIIGSVCSYIEREGPDVVGRVIDNAITEVSSTLDISATVRRKIESFPLDDLERLTYFVAGRELRMIEGLGAVIGFAVGMVQALVLWIIG